jgi:PIN domain nuclease of toxin-antitoxin system
VLVEVALLAERGRLRVGLAQVLETLSAHAGYAVLPLDVEQALAFASLVSIRDPIDRLVLAAAHATGARLVSNDSALSGHGVERLWD